MHLGFSFSNIRFHRFIRDPGQIHKGWIGGDRVGGWFKCTIELYKCNYPYSAQPQQYNLMQSKDFLNQMVQWLRGREIGKEEGIIL